LKINKKTLEQQQQVIGQQQQMIQNQLVLQLKELTILQDKRTEAIPKFVLVIEKGEGKGSNIIKHGEIPVTRGISTFNLKVEFSTFGGVKL